MRFYHSRCIGELPVVGGDNAAFAGRHVLRRVKAEAARIERSYLFTLVYRAVCLAGVLDDREPVMARMLAGWPYRSTGMMALVFLVIFFSTSSGSMLKVSASMSAKTGFAPVNRMLFAVAIKVNGVVMTSSPFPMPFANNATCRAAVPELTAIAWSTPMYFLNESSNSFTFGPSAITPDFMTPMTPSISSWPIRGFAIGII